MIELQLVGVLPGYACSFVHHDPVPITNFMGPTPEICSVKYRRHYHVLDMPVRAGFQTKWVVRGIDQAYMMFAEICLEEGILYYNWGNVPDNKALRWRMIYYLAHKLREVYGKEWKLGPRKKLSHVHQTYRERDRKELNSEEPPRHVQRQHL